MEERLLVHIDTGDALDVSRFSIYEAMSRPFEVTLFVRSPNTHIDFDKVVNRPASFRIASGVAHSEESVRTWTGVCSHFEQLRPEENLPGVRGMSTYLIRIVPTLWLLKLGSDNRIFRHKSIPDIVQEVLAEWEIAPVVKLVKPASHYKELEYVVQYDESDFNFVNRLLEAAGISYYFRHKPNAPNKLELSDEPHRGNPRSPVDWEDEPAEGKQIDFVTNVRLTHRVKPGRVTIRDYDFHQKSDFRCLGESTPIDGQELGYQIYYYEPGGLRVKARGSDKVADEGGKWAFRHLPDEGNNRANRVLWGLRQGKRTVSYDTNAVGLHPGRVFSMNGHPRDDLAASEKLLVTEYQMDGGPHDKWVFSGEAVFVDAPFVPPLRTPKPRIAGVQSAIVVGKKGEEIFPDEYGRVKAQLHWDRQGKYEESASCWMRVSQQWAGSRFGTMFIPRVGHEVFVSYFDGDPDQPQIIGRTYNMTRPVPYALPKHDTKSVWKTKTSPQSDKKNAYNEWRFDDATDSELLFIQAQKDFVQFTKRNETERTGKNHATVVGNHRTSVVAKVDTHLVGKKYSVQIVKTPDKGKTDVEDKKQLKIIEQLKPDLTPLPTKIEMVDKRIMVTSGKASLVMNDKEITFVAKGELSLEAGGMIYIDGGPKIKINC